jgi:hypothetical protein
LRAAEHDWKQESLQANNEIAVPLGDYTVWLEREGKIVSETKKVTVIAKKTVSERF